MKKILCSMGLQLITVVLLAQTDTSTVEQYCQVIATPRLLSNKVTIDIDYGEEKRFLYDERLRTYDGKLKKFNTIIDALNFMGREGWLFINAYPVYMANTVIYHYAFKKQFSRADISGN